MRYSHGVWYYQGRGYDTLRAALLAAEKNLPAGWRTRRERVSTAYPCAAYGGLGLGPAKPACCRENISIIPCGSEVCKG